MFYLKQLCAVMLMCICSLFFTTTAQASAEFNTSFHSTYTVQEKTTLVEHVIEIQNKLAHIYTREYTITVGSTDLEKLHVTTNGQIAPFERNDAAGITTLTISVPNPAIGKDQILRLHISYETGDLVEHYGHVWEVNIPRLLKANEAETYVRRVVTPNSFGPPTVEYPEATTVTNDESGNTVFEYRGYPSDSITLLFGNHVDYMLDLEYRITNPTIAAAETEIALPPDTEYQKILVNKIDPPPLRIERDGDGNWMAKYSLRSQETQVVKVSLFASIYPYPYYPSLAVPDKHLLEPADYWESRSDSVRGLATTLKTPDKIYEYLVANLDYDYERVSSGAERLGAVETLANPRSAICTEFTDAFVAIARAAGIPAREINGYAHTADSRMRPTGSTADTLHAWPEYYDAERKTWIQVDPTWGNTTGGIDYLHKMDYGHITFVRHGRESSYPYPAGSYKTDPGQKTIQVELASQVPADDIKTKVQPIERGYRIINTGNVALVNQAVKVSDTQTHTVAYLPPYGQEEVERREGGKLTIWQRIVAYFRSLL